MTHTTMPETAVTAPLFHISPLTLFTHFHSLSRQPSPFRQTRQPSLFHSSGLTLPSRRKHSRLQALARREGRREREEEGPE
eukprot:3330954-Rhodomonas_salina.1